MNFDLPPEPALLNFNSTLGTPASAAPAFPLPGASTSSNVNAVSGLSAAPHKARSPSFDLPPASTGFGGSSDPRVSALEQENQKLKQELNTAGKAIERYLIGKHKEEIAEIEAKVTELTASLAAEQSISQTLQGELAEVRTSATVAVDRWRAHSTSLQSQLASAVEQLQQQGTAQPHLAQTGSAAEQAAQLAKVTEEKESLTQAMHKLQQQVQDLQQDAAIKAEDSETQQKLEDAQTKITILESETMMLNSKLTERDAKLAETKPSLVALTEQLEAEKVRFDGTVKVLQAEVQEAARQYSSDIAEKDREIKNLKERSSNPRNGNRNKKSSHSLDDPQDGVKHRN